MKKEKVKSKIEKSADDKKILNKLFKTVGSSMLHI